MALSNTEVQITWSASNSTSVSSSSGATSDEVTVNSGTIQAMLMVKADNSGTPASGDRVRVYYGASLGDPDGASTAEFVSDDTLHPALLATLDTNTTDPAIVVVPLPMPVASYKLYVDNLASSNSITVSATMLEARVS